jgi:hypothetical protein
LLAVIDSRDANRWNRLLEAFSGFRYHENRLESAEREILVATRTDLIRLSRIYFSDSWRSETVEKHLFGVLFIALNFTLPEDLQSHYESFEKVGNRVPDFGGITDLHPLALPEMDLQRLLKDEKWGDAVSDALSGKREKVIPAARKLFGHPDPRVLRSALALLVALDSKVAEEELKSIVAFTDSDQLFAAAMHILHSRHLESLEPELREAVSSLSAERRVLALKTLASFALSSSEAIFIRHLADSDPDAKIFSIIGLARLRASHRLSSIVSLLSDSNTDVQTAAIEAVGQLGTGHKEWAALRPCLARVATRSAALRALSRLGDSTNVKPLALAHADDIWLRYRMESLSALARLGHYCGQEEALQPLLPDPYFDRDLAWELNWLKAPDVMKQLSSQKVTLRKWHGSVRDLAQHCSKDTSLKIHCELNDIIDIHLSPAQQVLSELLREVSRITRLVVVMDEGVIRDDPGEDRSGILASMGGRSRVICRIELHSASVRVASVADRPPQRYSMGDKMHACASH